MQIVIKSTLLPTARPAAGSLGWHEPGGCQESDSFVYRDRRKSNAPAFASLIAATIALGACATGSANSGPTAPRSTVALAPNVDSRATTAAPRDTSTPEGVAESAVTTPSSSTEPAPPESVPQDSSATEDSVPVASAPAETVAPVTVTPTLPAGPTIITNTTLAPTTIAPTAPAPATITPPAAETIPTTTQVQLPPNFAPVTDMSATPFRAVGTKSGGETKRIQARLLELGFWVNGVDGQYGLATVQAIMAFQKYTGIKATGKVDKTTAGALTKALFRASASATDNTLVEIDKAKQLLFLVNGGRTTWVFNTSTGSGKAYTERNQNDPNKIETGDAITPDGLWKIYRQREEGWWEGDLGKIYRPKYFVGGIAIHGMHTVPNYPASHGCVRLSLPAMDFIWANDLIPMKTPVWVHS
jgi:peptidoglycan hydrolase-like protein with peptidoglycan-binding domain